MGEIMISFPNRIGRIARHGGAEEKTSAQGRPAFPVEAIFTPPRDTRLDAAVPGLRLAFLHRGKGL